MPITQKVWTAKQAKFYISFFEIFVVAWFLMVIAGMYVLMDENYRQIPFHDLVFVLTLAGLFGFIIFSIIYKLSWPEAVPITAEQITDLYAKVSVCPHQLAIIQNAVKNNFILRQRDLEFANWIYKMHQARISKQVEDEKRQKVLQGIKHDCLTPESKIAD